MNTAEYNKIVDKFADNIYRFILKSLNNEHSAQDIVQETFEKLWINKKKVPAEKAKSYLFTTAYHLLIDNVRKNKRQTLFESYHENNYAYEEKNFDLKEHLNNALDKLPDIQKQLVLLRDYEGYSYKEIGQITNLSESQVKVYIFRARKTLKQLLGKIENLI